MIFLFIQKHSINIQQTFSISTTFSDPYTIVRIDRQRFLQALVVVKLTLHLSPESRVLCFYLDNPVLHCLCIRSLAFT